MSLQRNDMLSTEGRAPRARRSCYVNEPAYGFFIAGSSLRAMNGVYIRRTPPRQQTANEEDDEERNILLYYTHMDTGWTMMLAEVKETEPSQMYRSRDDESEWLFVDEHSTDCFSHKGNTIVPGAGVSWRHVHRASAARRAAPRPAGRGSQLANTKDDDEDELPWQVIAVLDYDILRQLVGGAEYHKQKVAEAKAGRGVVEPPALTSLEGCYLPGTWVYRVISEKGVPVLETPLDDGRPCGRHGCGEYVRGVELRHDGRWLKLESAAPRSFYSQARVLEQWVPLYGAASDGGEVLLERVEVADLSSVAVEGEEAEETVAEASASAEAAAAATARKARAKRSLAAEFLDQPFVPQLEGDEAAEGGSEGGSEAKVTDVQQAAAKAGKTDLGPEEPAEIAAAAATAAAAAAAFPVGAVVRVHGLSGADSARYNGTRGVIVSALHSESERQGVRLEAPFAGKRLHARPAHLTGEGWYDESGGSGDDDEVDAAEAAAEATAATPGSAAKAGDAAALVRHARTLGLRLADLAPGEGAPTSASAGASSPPATAKGRPTKRSGFALSGSAAVCRLDAALRCVQRDNADDPDVLEAAAAAHAALSPLAQARDAAAAADRGTAADGSSAEGDEGDTGESNSAAAEATDALSGAVMAPDARLRNGALGARVSAAATAAVSTASVREAQGGLGELRSLLLDEIDRTAREAFSLGKSLDQESADALRLRLALCLAHLQAGSDAKALEQASEAAANHAHSPAASFLLARCLLRVGRRAEALKALEKAAEPAPAATAAAGPPWVPSCAPPPPPRPAADADEPIGTSRADAPMRVVEEEEEDDEGDDEGEATFAPFKPRLHAAVSSAATQSAGAAGAAGVVRLCPDGAWARAVAAPMLRALQAAERRQVHAVALYERGMFAEAAASYGAAVACLEAGARDDVHGRATGHANAAACHRRDKKPDEAVRACDEALRLLPRFGRALFRRAASLLEGGRPQEAVDGFEELYRVDRNWPRLSDWLLRAHAAKRRMDEGGGTGHSPSGRKMPAYGSASASRSSGGGGSGSAGGEASPGTPGGGAEDGERLSKEPDHYVVLGVTIDATEKQIQQAYRMRSLKYHPDRKGGSTAAFQRIAQAFQTLSDPHKRAVYDQGGDLKSKRGGRDSDDSEDDDEERKQSLREEIERKYYPERYDFWPFGDPFINKRKREETKRRQQGRPQWFDPANDSD